MRLDGLLPAPDATATSESESTNPQSAVLEIIAPATPAPTSPPLPDVEPGGAAALLVEGLQSVDESAASSSVAGDSPKRRSRKKIIYPRNQETRAKEVLDLIFEDQTYPLKGAIPWPDVWDQICTEYKVYEQKKPSKLPMPSQRTFRRAIGWE
jgi:hypothetical protein